MRQPQSYLAVGIVFVCAFTGALRHDRTNRSSADLPGPAYHGVFSPPATPTWPRAAAVDLPAAPPAYPGKFELVGHEPLMNRGMNAALAVGGHYAYIGSRTDGTHPNAGVMVVDIADPTKPTVVGQIGLPDEAHPSESSRELRVLPDKQLLLVLNHGCSELIHECANGTQAGANQVTSTVKFYDIAGENGAAPKLVGTYTPSRSEPQTPHEIYVWTDPQRPSRVLLYETTPSTEASGKENLYVVDASHARENTFTEIAHWTTLIADPEGADTRLHSLTVSADGNRAYLAYLGGGFMVADTSDFAQDRPNPQIRLITPVANRVHWNDPGAHSAIQIPGRHWVMTTDEVYGKLGGLLPAHGCPWGWVRFIDISDPAAPRLAGDYRPPWNRPEVCNDASDPPDRENFSSFSSHNPTLTPHMALVTWHSAGLMALDISDPEHVSAAAQYLPDPLPAVETEDPALSSGRDKVVMWSFPVVKDGLIYVVDLRNGLYILRYKGPHEGELANVGFLDGNTNSGDVGRFEHDAAPAAPAGETPSGGAPPIPGPIATPHSQACLPGPLRLGRRTLGPFALGQTRAAAALRAGPAMRVRRAATTWCVEGKRRAVAVFSRTGRLVLAVSDRVSGAPKRARGTLSLKKGRVLVARRGRVRLAGVTSLRSKRSVRRALKSAGLR